MFEALTILIILAAVLLTLVVLIQRPKGGGLAAQFSSSNLAFGVKRTTDFIEKSTWVLAIIIIVLSMSANFVIGAGVEGEEKEVKAINVEQLQELQSTPIQTPQAPAAPQGGEQPAGGGIQSGSDASQDDE
ncbi:MAG TPA: preprotein translocase subunit SecG [Bacteroidia bacterium]|nr:preprotein translocase subunit SecG [Bacteroidia bacterium]